MPFSLSEREFSNRLSHSLALKDKSNCVGTALYLGGFKNKDSMVHPDRAREIFPRHFELTQNTTNQQVLRQYWNRNQYLPRGAYVALNGVYNNFDPWYPISHVLLIHPFDSNKVVHRTDWHENVVVQPLDELLESYLLLTNLMLLSIR